MATMTELQGKAQEAASWFESALRDENDSESDYIRKKEGAPEWVAELVYAAHGEFLPDDFRYQGILSALEWIAEEEDEGDAFEFAYENVDVYTGRLLQWLASNLQRVGYVDEASEELGDASGGIVEMITRGQAVELAEIYHSVRNSLLES